MAKKQKQPTASDTVSATEAARNFSELLNRVRYQQKAFVVERGGEAVCEIRPVYQSGEFTGADLARLLSTLPDAPKAYLDAVEEGIKKQPRAEDTRWPR
jgi:hypothetical protein